MLCGVAAVTKVNLHKLSASSFDSFHLSLGSSSKDDGNANDNATKQ